MSLSIKVMQLFVAVLDAGSFSEVARREGMSPSSVSRTVQQLENSLGSQLLSRTTRHIVPTAAGQLYGDTFRRMLAELNATQQQLQEHDAEPGGLLRINAPVVFGQKHLAPWLPALAQRHPRLQIALNQTDDFVDPLTDPADLLFRIAPLRDSGLHARVIDRSRHFLAASPDYLARCGTPARPEDLHRHSCLVYKGVMGAQKCYFSRADRPTVALALTGALLSNNAETLVNAALGGMGIVMMPDWQIGELLQQRRLIALLPDYRVSPQPQELAIAMLYPQTRFVPLNVRAAIDFFTVRFGSPPYWKYS